jgi:hypothetical protein
VLANQAKNRRKNAKRKGARIGKKYTVSDIVARDGIKCHLCNRNVNIKLSGADHYGPTIDHLLPLAAGGLDELANVKLAHRCCNVRRRDAGEVQLLLFG